ncbi:aspartyl protease family protein At5g10770 [Brachypodium distachyon]|uniref:Peptidase A1 domain-containing protein n=1 Tax=Brachypodium distachyon TaxID=15368 RepID=I1H1J0_BRADI|nr:aspartyl protease family protein At5g10770 [Brachypodium distachyon]KQK19838.1 hypothetical protein BRADI_1g50760v3 [Brachypodium distachyon]|eukprot:XP_003561171.1 aspartyl protease family protein At5g10770 [Brachypodium distachyon]
MAPLVPLVLLLLFSHSSTATSSSVDIGHAAEAELSNHHVVVAASSLELANASPVCQGHRVSPSSSGGSWAPLSHLHSPCSPAAGGRDSAPPPKTLSATLQWDEHRAGHIQRKLSGNAAPMDDAGEETPQSTQVTSSPAANVNVGKSSTDSAFEQGIVPAATGPGGQKKLPGVAQSMVVDTASDVPWVQCAPCPQPQCYAQSDVLYDPTKSILSAPFPCSSPQCRSLGRYANGCTGAGNTGTCQYRVLYPDGSGTSGTYVSDLLTLNADPKGAVSKFQFGCSHALLRPGSFNNKTAGFMALGRGAQSLSSQTKGTFSKGNVFSYCLPPTGSHKGFLSLGVPQHAASRYAVTPMLKSKMAPMIYMVRLIGIDVAGQRLPVPPAVFAANAAMDSRTIITRLPPTAYMALRAAFRAQMRAYRAVAPKGQLDTCYDFTGVPMVRLPKVTLVFDRNAAVELDPSGVMLDSCLAFAPNANDFMPGIIGNVQQQTLEVLYNVDGASVGFRRAAC